MDSAINLRRHRDAGGRGRRRHDREEKVGLVPARKPAGRRTNGAGFAPVNRPDVPPSGRSIALCHTAEIDGCAHFGAGTKGLRRKVLATPKLLTHPRSRLMLERSPLDDRLASRAHDILTRHHHDKIDSLTRARSTAFAASHVELYMRPHGGAMPAEAEVGRGDVKVPPLWHTAAKMPAGRWYVDGSFHGPFR
jgi:hypothetical protein